MKLFEKGIKKIYSSSQVLALVKLKVLISNSCYILSIAINFRGYRQNKQLFLFSKMKTCRSLNNLCLKYFYKITNILINTKKIFSTCFYAEVKTSINLNFPFCNDFPDISTDISFNFIDNSFY